MPRFTVNAPRANPYLNFNFVLSWDGVPVLGVAKVSPLSLTTQGVESRSGGDPDPVRVSPGQTEYAPITLERGVTHDSAFELWAQQGSQPDRLAPPSSGEDASLADFRKDLTLDVYNEDGQKVRSYQIYRCWVSECVAVPELESMGNAVAIESITLENEGWQRDDALADPTEP